MARRPLTSAALAALLVLAAVFCSCATSASTAAPPLAGAHACCHPRPDATPDHQRVPARGECPHCSRTLTLESSRSTDVAPHAVLVFSCVTADAGASLARVRQALLPPLTSPLALPEALHHRCALLL